MRFGLVLTTYLWNEDRYRWARSSYASLARTQVDGLAKPLLLAVLKRSRPYDAAELIAQHSFPQFDLQVREQPPDCRSNDGALGWGWDLLAHTDVTHLMLVTDDWIFNPYWLLELRNLIERKPNARAWWVYRSAYEEIHKTLRIEPDAVLVRSINGMGCIDVREWKDWAKNWRRAPRETGSNGSLSLDLLHPRERPGDRWVTPRSYIANIGLVGSCQGLETPDLAVDFVGEHYVPAAPDPRPDHRPDSDSRVEVKSDAVERESLAGNARTQRAPERNYRPWGSSTPA